MAIEIITNKKASARLPGRIQLNFHFSDKNEKDELVEGRATNMALELCRKLAIDRYDLVTEEQAKLREARIQSKTKEPVRGLRGDSGTRVFKTCFKKEGKKDQLEDGVFDCDTYAFFSELMKLGYKLVWARGVKDLKIDTQGQVTTQEKAVVRIEFSQEAYISDWEKARSVEERVALAMIASKLHGYLGRKSFTVHVWDNFLPESVWNVPNPENPEEKPVERGIRDTVNLMAASDAEARRELHFGLPRVNAGECGYYIKSRPRRTGPADDE